MDWITGPGTIEDLVADSKRVGYLATVRLVRDWTEAGLLDVPQRRPAGKGHGSHRALYPANQRRLLLTLLHHRQTHRIRTLARIPVSLWTYWGNDYVPTRQAIRALRTWLGDARSTQKNARISAGQILGTLDHPDATDEARQELRDALTNVAWTGRMDPELDRKIRSVFEPHTVKIRRALGHPSAPLTSDTIIGLIDARLKAVTLLNDPAADPEPLLEEARQHHLQSLAEYAGQQKQMARVAPSSNPDMYAPLTLPGMIDTVCIDLLTVLGLTVARRHAHETRSATPDQSVI
ncbi:hypothetical protein ABIB25_000961 [Nakamurella sp. UYEF19]|uniref:hypothetical protein n=1 Tax=Nakamurella sp. UYEF19 TaxID=1756392 RepID=UPI0033967DD3